MEGRFRSSSQMHSVLSALSTLSPVIRVAGIWAAKVRDLRRASARSVVKVISLGIPAARRRTESLVYSSGR